MNQFLIRLLKIDVSKLIADEMSRRLEAQGLSIAKVEEMTSDDMFGPSSPLQRVVLSDGRTFVHKLVRSESGDDWGNENWELRPEDEETVVEKLYRE
jgi:hypothetical protein